MPRMHLGDVANPEAAPLGKPLDGVRVLAAEQMQALPYATQLLARLGADVVKVEHPGTGESGRGAYPHMLDPEGRKVGATFLRNNLGKRSVALDLKHPEGRELFLALAGRFDVVCENFKAGTMDRLGLGYDDVAAVHPGVIYLSISGFGNAVDALDDSPYQAWPAYAAIVEAMSGIYEYKREPGRRPRANPVGALGDISSALFGTIGVLAALRQRDRTGRGQLVDVAMLDAVMAMTDIVTNMWSLGIHGTIEDEIGAIIDTFACGDGHFVVQAIRPQHFTALAEVIGRPEWNDDPRFATGHDWIAHAGEVREAVEAWAAGRSRAEAVAALSAAGLAAGPCLTPPEVIADPHVAARHMLVEAPRPDGGDPVLVPGNPVKLSAAPEGPETRVPWLGEHTAEVLAAELGLDEAELARLRDDGVVG
jgi:crotonobetainyl-CoA:carnitine CoA-transferase CaiB-like acyl-CoA transferase